MYTLSFIVGNIIPKSVKCIHSATRPQKGDAFFGSADPDLGALGTGATPVHQPEGLAVYLRPIWFEQK